MNVHFPLLALAIIFATNACSSELGSDTSSDELRTNEIAAWSPSDCKQDAEHRLANITSKSKAAITAARKAIEGKSSQSWQEVQGKGIDPRKQGTCFVVTNNASTPSIVSLHANRVSAKGGCTSLASALKGATCKESEIRVYEIAEKLCKPDHIYVAASQRQNAWLYDEYNSAILPSNAKLLITECGQQTPPQKDQQN
jgi:hypothetical protein